MNMHKEWPGRGQVWIWALAASLWLGGCAGGEQGGATGIVAPDTTTTPLDSLPPQERVSRLTALIQISPKNWELWFDRGYAWYELGNTQQAIEDCSKSIELHVTNPEGYQMRGFYYYGLNQDSAALRDFDRAAQVGSQNPETFYMRGQVYFLRKDYASALKDYDQAIKLDTLSPTYRFAKGYLHEAQGRLDDAIAVYREALELDPGFVKVLLALHDLYLDKKKDPDQAYLFNDRVLKVDSMHPVGRFNQGNFFMARANNLHDEKDLVNFQVLLKLAVGEFTTALRRDPQFVQAYYNRGYAQYLLEDYPKALSDFDRVIQQDPMNEKAFFMKASIQEFQGDLVSALANYEQAAKLKPDFFDAASAVKELKAKLKTSKPAGGAEKK